MEIFVINLRRSAKRRDLMSRQLEQLGLPFRIHEATDGKSLDEGALNQHCRFDRDQRQLTPGQIGCALSHYSVYRTIIAENIETALILEDDLQLSPNLPVLLPALEQQLQDGELILLYFVPGRECQITRSDQFPLPHGYQLRYPMSMGNVLSATAYVLRNKTAQQLADTVYPIHLCADWWGAINAEGGLTRLRCIMPSPVQLRPELPSDIGLGQLQNRYIRAAMDLVNRYDLFPLNKLLAWNRARVMAKLQGMCTFTDQPSPLRPDLPEDLAAEVSLSPAPESSPSWT